MATIRLNPPKGYDRLKPLHDSTGRPIRCTPVSPPPQDQDDQSTGAAHIVHPDRQKETHE